MWTVMVEYEIDWFAPRCLKNVQQFELATDSQRKERSGVDDDIAILARHSWLRAPCRLHLDRLPRHLRDVS
jgi:hypothetical protein